MPNYHRRPMYARISNGSSRSALTVIPLFSDAPTLPTRYARAPGAPEALRTFKGDVGEAVALGHILMFGVGRRADLTLAAVRTVGAKLIRTLDRIGATAVRLESASTMAPGRDRRFDAGQAFGEALAVANWRMDLFDGTATKREPRRARLAVDADDRDFAEGMARGLTIGASVNEARRIAATPPNICTPDWVASQCRSLARAHGMRCSVIPHAKAKSLGMGGLTAVGRGSAHKPCLVSLEHRPRSLSRAARGKHLVLVGKTITYDTGGYSLKVNNGMKGMKYDKCGGAAVIGAMHAIASLKLPLHVTALLPAAENMVSDDAYRPDDIITMHNGVTVEVTNTDAEGRLVLADALSWACRKLAPTAIVDMATLTGGVVTALGKFSAGYFCTDEALRARVEDAATATGEKVWQLPLWPEHREYMRAQHADIINSNPSREAHPIQGAAFLAYFVDAGIPWAHVDIAGVSSSETPSDLCVPGPTGWGVRLLASLAERMA
jgi:leucyl aminopeptidase